VEDAADGVTSVIIQRFVENAHRDSAGVEHEILADVAAGIGEAIRKLFVGGKQEEAGGFRAIGGNDYGLGLLSVGVTLGIEIRGTDGAATVVEFDFVDVGIRADFAVASFFGHANGGGERTGFCADLTPEAQTKTTIDASTAAGVRLGKNGHGRRKRMPTELASGTFKNYAAGFYGKRGHGIRLGTRRIEGTGAGESGDADFPFDLGVVGLKVGIGDGPIHEIGAGDGADLAALNKIDFVEAPEVRGEMHTGAADEAAVHESALLFGCIARSFTESIGLQLGVIGEQILLQNFDFVVDEIIFCEVGPLFENDYAEAVAGQFLGENAAGGTGADDYKIDFVGGAIFRCFDWEGGHDLVFSGARVQPG